MKNTGIVRKIDELGRIVLPKELRKSLNINSGDDFEICVEDDKIFLSKYSRLNNIESYLRNIVDCFNVFENIKIYLIINDFLLDNRDENVNELIINILHERKLYVKNNNDIMNITKNITISNMVVLYPIVINSDLLGGILVVGKNINEQINIAKVIYNIIKTYYA